MKEMLVERILNRIQKLENTINTKIDAIQKRNEKKIKENLHGIELA